MTRIGIEIGGTKQQIIAGDNQGNIVDRCRFGMEPNANASDIQKRITEELPKLITAHQPERIGVGFGGPVDIAQGKVATSHQIEGWSGFPLLKPGVRVVESVDPFLSLLYLLGPLTGR